MRGGRERAQRNLYVLNLPLDATTDQFEALFAQYGKVEHAVILATLDHLARRRGFILMSDPAQARAAIDSLDSHTWHNYRLEVSFAIVQRSGTPFSQETTESPRDERIPQSKPSGVVSQPDEHQTQADVLVEPARISARHQAQQGRLDATLLLSGLDKTVISSSAMIRALTEPFGHVAELFYHDQPQDLGSGGHATIVYCCPSSASLARLALHGLTVGRRRVQAGLAGMAQITIEYVRRTEAEDLNDSAAHLPEQLYSAGPRAIASQNPETSGLSMISDQVGAGSAYASSAEAGATSYVSQFSDHSQGTRPDRFRPCGSSSGAADELVSDDSVFKQKVSLYMLSCRVCLTSDF
uniref:Telomere maintenance protein n=1 Tax=Melanopsichium pennsylvanicum 4 TaxID=1398559 RepID=A0A077R2I1_9BASI|nr:telomere maintenance protein [Melanopsichium pennsylvanicum 4]